MHIFKLHSSPCYNQTKIDWTSKPISSRRRLVLSLSYLLLESPSPSYCTVMYTQLTQSMCLSQCSRLL